MDMVHKIMKNKKGLDASTWFEKAETSRRATRITVDPLIIKHESG
jgi:hypothetical protein